MQHNRLWSWETVHSSVFFSPIFSALAHLQVFFAPPSMRNRRSQFSAISHGFPPDSRRLSSVSIGFGVIFNQLQSILMSFYQFDSAKNTEFIDNRKLGKTTLVAHLATPIDSHTITESLGPSLSRYPALTLAATLLPRTCCWVAGPPMNSIPSARISEERTLERPCASQEGASMLLRRESSQDSRREGTFLRREGGFLGRGGRFLRRFVQ